jgi:Tfp pilus assembly protein PilN
MKPVNLLPDELRPRNRSRDGRGPAHILIGVLAVLLVMAVAYALTLNQANSRKTDIARAKSEIEKAKSQVAASTAFGDFHSVKETRVSSVKQLSAGRFDWERLMRELALVLPDKVWLQEATAATTGDPSQGGASTAGGSTPPPSANAGANASAPGTDGASSGAGASPSVDLKGCATDQNDVAVLLVRLRKLHRADSVDLKESAQETTEQGVQTSGDSGGSSENCGHGQYKFDVAVTFSPDTEGEKPAGGKVPAALGGGS